ncbi:SatD family protein [Globicatella sanguinis]|uniref:SatD family protein n=1 Tax=Globicatella sanguinis TaxID=13076 RepID=UPI000824C06C|nr:SatD family protein [Globicatella sanguinis]MDK7631128.1 SatD family protein [Globicatella sanguinis]WIK67047.1 SatD family protein [Globicatella sanguinis]WKT56452.1 SatD family protein [Globicatella sanguinis]
MQYIAMIGDVIESKSIKERQQSQDQLNKIMKQLNEQYQTTIVFNFTITIGDELSRINNSILISIPLILTFFTGAWLDI